MIRRPPRSTLSSSSAASDVYKRQQWVPLSSARALRLLDPIFAEVSIRSLHLLSEMDLVHRGDCITQPPAAQEGEDLQDPPCDERTGHTYGEFGLLACMWALKECNAANEAGCRHPLRVCYDLGSGSGRLLMFLSLVTDMTRLCGIEMLPSLHKTAEGMLAGFQDVILPQMDGPAPTARLDFVHGDLLEEDWSDADVILVTGTCFPERLMDAIEAKASITMRPGSFCISITHCFKGPCWEPVSYTHLTLPTKRIV
eukprot:TRINITY_DN2149_c0_g1_i14.p1 TRINITY_DN2149_c0_g1~~TRINITY_DN2149_c0_g1_i14.p1  ORF type:complete len:255 (-),score=58.00 TRINITY_DN2149_c0_g1_i14:94-858(-)